MRYVSIALALVSALVLTALVATPAGASSFSLCDPIGPPAALSQQPGGAVAGRGTTAREPDLGQIHQDLPASAKGKAAPGFAATIPVYFHVITDGRIGRVSDSHISAQIRVLNTTFAGGEGGAATGFSFVLAGVTRTDNADWFYGNLGGVNENAMKRALRQGGTNALNVYTTAGAGFLGWAFLPDVLTKPGQAHLDGVVLHWETMPRTSDTFAGRFDQGETLTHEVGHWLNLEHTFFGGCSAKGDFVEDTPAEKTPTSGCPIGKDTCREPGLDPIHNYMDYSFDSCYTEFTEGQAQRMRDAWLFYRAPA